MEDTIEDLLLSCSGIDFGIVKLSEGGKKFRAECDNEVISLCKSLPQSTQADGLLLLMRYFGIPFGEELSFFSHYYAPSWSIIYWLIQSGPGCRRLDQNDIRHAKKAHGMALLLHPIDDHLNDNEWQTTHLSLLLRSQAWMIMNNALKQLATEVSGGEQIARVFIDDYYSSIRSSENVACLDTYCGHFRKQMATWLIVPALLTKKAGADEAFSDAVQNAYGSFGIAWRLLDDINDIEADMMKGEHSSIYHCLPETIRNHWDKETEDKNGSGAWIILNYVKENSLVDRLKERTCSELESAASILNDWNMSGLADEFRSLWRPLKNGHDS